ncbi:MAG: ABC transporter permease [Lachnospiraceae bacterium]|nr:ABC transporter permease [Lachnospiraceae bacterium]
MKNELKGFGKVFCFTFIQAVKGKAIIVSTLMLAVLSAVIFPLMQKFTQVDTTKVETVVFLNETEYTFSELKSFVQEIEGYDKVKIETPDKTREEAIKELETGEDTDKKVLVIASMKEGQFYLEFMKNKDGSLSEANINIFAENFLSAFQTALATENGVSKEQLSYLQSDVETEIKYINEVNEEEQENAKETGKDRFMLDATEYNIFFALIFLSMMFIMLSGESIATSIVTEKSTRVIEYLMISIRPMALILGKVLAMLLVMLMQIGISAVVAAISNVVTGNGNSGNMVQMVSEVAPSLAENLNLASIVVSLLFLILGFMFYSFIAGLAGAAVSKLEEVAEGMKIYSMATLIGVYLSMFLGIMSQGASPNPVLKYAAMFLPLSSVFCIPEFLMMGKIGFGLALASLLVLLVCLVILAFFVSRVYESMILHRGEPIKLKAMIQLGMNKKKAVKK